MATITLTHEEIKAIAEEVAKLLSPAVDPNEVLDKRQAAALLGVQWKTKASLSAAFSRFANPRYYKNPLKGSRAGREYVYRKIDVLDFLENLRRG